MIPKINLSRHNLKILSAIICIAVISSASTWFVATAQNGTLPPLTLSSGQYPSASSYTIFTDGTVVYAKNAYGVIIASSTDASNVFNNLGSGQIYISDGVYHFQSKVVGKDGQYYVGESMGAFDNYTEGVNLLYMGGVTDSFFDMRGCRGIGFSNLKLDDYSQNATIGLWLGAAANDATKPKCDTFSNIVVVYFAYDIQGYTFGPDDSSFIDCYIGIASLIGIDHLSSQCKFVGGSIYSDTIGVRIYRNSGAGSADASMIFTGTTFSGCATPIVVGGVQPINELSFYGCWFEDVSNMLFSDQNMTAGDTVGTVLFSNCIGTTETTTFMDLSGRNIQLNWQDGELYPINGVGANIVCNGTGGTYQDLSITPLIGRDLITIVNNDGNAGQGVQGIHSACFFICNSGTGLNSTTLATFTSVAGLPDVLSPINGLTVVKATVYYNYAGSGNIRLLYGGQNFGAPTTSQGSFTIADITNFVRSNFTPSGEIGVQAEGDGATNLIIYSVEIIYQW